MSSSETRSNKTKSKKTEVADSWEDEADGISDAESRAVNSQSANTFEAANTASLPAPSTLSNTEEFVPFGQDGSYGGPAISAVPEMPTGGPRKRPEQSTAVAARLIAAGIGVKAPRRTQEQKDYDRAMKLQVKKQKDDAREAEERKKLDKEKAQRDIWGD